MPARIELEEAAVAVRSGGAVSPAAEAAVEALRVWIRRRRVQRKGGAVRPIAEDFVRALQVRIQAVEDQICQPFEPTVVVSSSSTSLAPASSTMAMSSPSWILLAFSVPR